MPRWQPCGANSPRRPELADKIGAVGYCWGGSIADLAACRTDINAAVSYYGRATVGWLNEQPRCPVLYHFGALDPLIPPELVQQITAGRPGQTVHIYAEAGHGFNCDDRHEFHAASAGTGAATAHSNSSDVTWAEQQSLAEIANV